jgi:hypothetical protein
MGAVGEAAVIVENQRRSKNDQKSLCSLVD